MTQTGDSQFVDYYAVLGVAPSAESSHIRHAYIAKAKQHHPDAGGSNAGMQQLNVAYKTLMSSTTKAAYDLLHSFQTGSTQPADYRYQDGREVHDIDDMNDAEIDDFLDTLLAEYRNGPPKAKRTMLRRMGDFFGV